MVNLPLRGAMHLQLSTTHHGANIDSTSGDHQKCDKKKHVRAKRYFLQERAVELVQGHHKQRVNINATPKVIKNRLIEAHVTTLENQLVPSTAKRGLCNKGAKMHEMYRICF